MASKIPASFYLCVLLYNNIWLHDKFPTLILDTRALKYSGKTLESNKIGNQSYLCLVDFYLTFYLGP